MAKKSGFNTQTILGRVGQDPELRHTAAGTAVVNFSLADTDVWDEKEETTWHRCFLFGKAAEIVAQYVKKGDMFFVQGRTVQRKFTDKNGQERTSHEVKVKDFAFVGGGNRDAQSGGDNEPQMRPRDDLDDDIPF